MRVKVDMLIKLSGWGGVPTIRGAAAETERVLPRSPEPRGRPYGGIESHRKTTAALYGC
jgi:hypothetical protein